jgi:hypothetical protein
MWTLWVLILIGPANPMQAGPTSTFSIHNNLTEVSCKVLGQSISKTIQLEISRTTVVWRCVEVK